MSFNQKDARILKMHHKGMKPDAIATKIGYGGPNLKAGIERVIDALKRAGVIGKDKEPK